METEQIAGLECLVSRPPAAVASLVLLHGYAMDAHDLAPLAEAMRLPVTLCVPRAPRTVPRGGRCWWPIDESRRAAQLQLGPRDLWREHPPFRPELRATVCTLLDCLDQARGPLPRFLAGFSQGGMLCIDTLLQARPPLAGLGLFSTSCIALDEWQPLLPAVRELPTLLCHGTADADLAFAAGERLRDTLRSGGARVTWHPFDGGHEMPFTVWRQLKRFVAAALT